MHAFPGPQADAGRSSAGASSLATETVDPSTNVTASNELLSIFFPMWNEEDYVERAIAAATAICTQMVDDGEIGDYELIIVDDKSTDRTPRDRRCPGRRGRPRPGRPPRGQPQARRLDQDRIRDGQGRPRAVLRRRPAVRLRARCPGRSRLLRLYDADLVSAYRFDRTGEGYTRAIYTFFYNLLIRTMFGVKARDINFAFKLVRRNVLDYIELRSEGSFIDAELIIRAIRSGFELQQFGVDYFPRTDGRVDAQLARGDPARSSRRWSRLRGDLDRSRPAHGRRRGLRHPELDTGAATSR